MGVMKVGWNQSTHVQGEDSKQQKKKRKGKKKIGIETKVMKGYS